MAGGRLKHMESASRPGAGSRKELRVLMVEDNAVDAQL
jgi:hypothetical protein